LGNSDWASGGPSFWQPQYDESRMMFSRVNNNCEAIIKVAVGHISSPKTTIDTVIGTKFTSFLFLLFSIPADIVLH
jgi:hypothetical protein